MYGILILAIDIWNENIVLVRSVCLQDVLSFHISDIVCSFSKDDFKRIFLDNSYKCQINCSIESSDPPYSALNDSKYEIKRINIKIRFTSTTYEFPMRSSCSNGDVDNFYMDLYCEGEYLHERGIGENCINNSQCASANINSTCNDTLGVCQCRMGYLYLWETNTCSQVVLPKHVDLGEAATIPNYAKKLTEERNDNSGIIFGVGIAGFVLGIAVCGMIYIIMIWYRNRYQSRSDKRREDFTEKESVLVSRTSSPHPTYNQNEGDILEGNYVYNHLHEDPSEICVQPDYDHVQLQAQENCDYSHMTPRNAHSIDIPGEYGVVS